MKTLKTLSKIIKLLETNCIELVKTIFWFWNDDYEDDHQTLKINEENVELLFQPVIDKSKGVIVGIESIPFIATSPGQKFTCKTASLLTSERYKKKNLFVENKKIRNVILNHPQFTEKNNHFY